MFQPLGRRSVSSIREPDSLTAFAGRHGLKVRVDEDGTKIIPGKFGQIYEYGDGRLAVMVIPKPPRKNYWGGTQNRLAKLGFVIVQNGDCEGAALFDPTNSNQAKAAIKAAGTRRKRQLSPAQVGRQISWLRASAGRAL